ncbi:hypothetical protein [Phenylobacterium sp.]|uniref:hypothetical protein n=1 Tax=Phenylobacterium sp. TaxID=1871053 RepID=UPI003D27285F
MTGALVARVRQHKHGTFEGFSKTYGCKTLIWCEVHAVRLEAIRRESRSSAGGEPGSWNWSRPRTQIGAIFPATGSGVADGAAGSRVSTLSRALRPG